MEFCLSRVRAAAIDGTSLSKQSFGFRGEVKYTERYTFLILFSSVSSKALDYPNLEQTPSRCAGLQVTDITSAEVERPTTLYITLHVFTVTRRL